MAALASVAAVEIEFPSCTLFAINSLLSQNSARERECVCLICEHILGATTFDGVLVGGCVCGWRVLNVKQPHRTALACK